ncbi:lipocalin-like domain-containing protein [Microvirga massiliensis]|uniref:lipocalin-like domain-containing protein n=1 Tax=Microvirga massiliensis TaxID=1033741 RepID=UPI000660608C|nr:lipocalin-like domain-containing protein [Microvirga massiliensis]
MNRKVDFIAFISLFVLPSAIAHADENPLIGTWKLKTFVREIAATGERYNQLGEHPDGYLGYSGDGRMYVIFTADNRVKPRGATPTDEERIELHRSMLAYGGTYTRESGKVTHHIDIDWNGTRVGTDQVRFFTREGNTLTIRTEPNKSPVDGREGVGVLVFEKVTSSVK